MVQYIPSIHLPAPQQFFYYTKAQKTWAKCNTPFLSNWGKSESTKAESKDLPALS
jgi:hypothetical protein